MVRKSAFVIGLGLALLWWIGLSEQHSARILWFDAVAAVLSFGIGGLVEDPPETAGQALGGAMTCAVMGLGLGALWIAGMAAHQPGWANWLNLLFAVGYLATAAGTVGHGRQLTPAHRRP